MIGRNRSGDRTIPLRKVIPNLFTCAAMCSGLAGVYFASKAEPDFARACAAVGMAALLDGLDGRAARLLKATSRFGETFDSISDFVAFGMAPAFILYRFCQPHAVFMGVNLEGLVFMATVLFALCSALRLARFTAMQRRKKLNAKPSKYFMGMPTPAAAGAALVPPLLMLSDLQLQLPVLVVVVHTLLVAAMMISRWPMFAFKTLRIDRRWVVPLMVGVGLVVVGVARDAWLTAAGICLAYMGSMALSIRAARQDRWDERPPSFLEPADEPERPEAVGAGER
jgi:CDP-diacylglycerol--serine O-phosphatidyltransferase